MSEKDDLCASKRNFYRGSLKNIRARSCGTVLSSIQSLTVDELETSFQGKALMKAQGSFTPSCKYLPCNTGDPFQKEDAPPKTCPCQHR